MTTPRQPLELKVGGQLNPRKHLFVSRRDVENELYENLARGEYCNILSSRQVGKSSAMMKTALRLKEDGVRVVTIDVAGELGTPEKTAGEWCQGFLTKLVRDLKSDFDVNAWWSGQSGTANQRLMEFFRTQLFVEDDSPVVIFVDEVDSTLKLPYTDDFFTGIRTMYSQRASEPSFEKIAFCLIGVASPNELVKDRRTTSYNVGTTIEFRDFDIERDDLSGLVAALCDDQELGAELLRAILNWTGGHPYLTLWFCQEVQKRELASVADVSSLAEDSFASIHKVDSDVHFQQITRYLSERVTDQLAALRLYASVLKGNAIKDKRAATHIELKLSGLVQRDQNGNLSVRNHIYENIFNRQWVRQTAPQRTLCNARVYAVAATILLLLGVGYFQLVIVPDLRAKRLVESLLVAQIDAVPGILDHVSPSMRNSVNSLLKAELDKPALSPTLLEELRENPTAQAAHVRVNTRRRLNSSLALMHLGEFDAVRPLLKFNPDPTDQTLLLDQLASVPVEPRVILERVRSEVDPSVRRALLLSLSEIKKGGIDFKVGRLIREIYTEDPSAGVHSAARLLMRRWNVALPVISPSEKVPTDRDWKVTPQGLTMVRIPAGKFSRRMSDEEENEVTFTFTRDLWLSDVEVTVGRFQQFIDDNEYEGPKPKFWRGVNKDVSPSEDHPARSVSWEDAVLFCNWLSHEEKRTPYYEVELDKAAQREDGYLSKVDIVPDADGYRLPTEAEWEYACRAGSTTTFTFGDVSDRVIQRKYMVFGRASWVRVGTTEHCGQQLPNAWGLFDVHGNVWEWCHDWYTEKMEGGENPRRPSQGANRVYRGGSWGSIAKWCGSSYRSRFAPSPRFVPAPAPRYYNLGFRVASVSSSQKRAGGAENRSR